jgi:transposase-like protein
MVHKTANVLNKMPKGSQAKARRMLHDIYQAEVKAWAQRAFDLFVATYEAKYPKATECLAKDREELLSFSDFPAEHWVLIRTTSPIESVFSTVRPLNGSPLLAGSSEGPSSSRGSGRSPSPENPHQPINEI